MKPFSLLMTCLISISAFSQIRIISHISKTAGGFTPGVIIANFDNQPHSYSLNYYGQDGMPKGMVAGNVDGNKTIYATLNEMFGTDDVSHFTIMADDEVRVSTTYESTSGNGSPAHVHESNIQSKTWRVYPGKWNVIWDGIAVVNTGNSATDITITQKSSTGSTIKTVKAIEDLNSLAKGLFVFGSGFSQVANSHFEISGDQPLAITSLRGSNNNTFLWENAALAPTANTSSSFVSTYTRFTHLANSDAYVTSDWVKLPTTSTSHQFVKAETGTAIEIQVNSRFYGGLFDGGLATIFEVRVDGIASLTSNYASILESDKSAFESIFAVFENLSAGPHTVSIWAKSVPAGSNSDGVMLDPGNIGGSIIVKETM